MSGPKPEVKGQKRAMPIAALEIFTAAGIALFWAAWFAGSLAPENPPACYFAFERAFPVPDLVLALSLLAAGILLLKGRPAGRALSLACAGALVFLGLLDASFNFQNGIYSASATDLAMNGLLNLWCVGLGAAILGRLRQ
ncbi:hypothetical protein ACFL4G_05450 [Thermodesulfobacteriota bacterium]